MLDKSRYPLGYLLFIYAKIVFIFLNRDNRKQILCINEKNDYYRDVRNWSYEESGYQKINAFFKCKQIRREIDNRIIRLLRKILKFI